MSDTNQLLQEPFGKPHQIDEGTYLRIKTLRPLDAVVIPLIEKLIEVTDYMRKIRPWYAGQRKNIPRETLSPMLDPETKEPVTFEQLRKIFCDELAKQEK